MTSELSLEAPSRQVPHIQLFEGVQILLDNRADLPVVKYTL